MVSEDSLNKIIVARFADGSLAGVGRCVTYVDAPTISLLKPDGTSMHWRADMCSVVDLPADVSMALLPNSETKEP